MLSTVEPSLDDSWFRRNGPCSYRGNEDISECFRDADSVCGDVKNTVYILDSSGRVVYSDNIVET